VLQGHFSNVAYNNNNNNNNSKIIIISSSSLKKETEVFVMAVQDQALRTNVIRVKIVKQDDDTTCRMCKNKEETIAHIASECSKLARLEYKCRHECPNRPCNRTPMTRHCSCRQRG